MPLGAALRAQDVRLGAELAPGPVSTLLAHPANTLCQGCGVGWCTLAPTSATSSSAPAASAVTSTAASAASAPSPSATLLVVLEQSGKSLAEDLENLRQLRLSGRRLLLLGLRLLGWLLTLSLALALRPDCLLGDGELGHPGLELLHLGMFEVADGVLQAFTQARCPVHLIHCLRQLAGLLTFSQRVSCLLELPLDRLQPHHKGVEQLLLVVEAENTKFLPQLLQPVHGHACAHLLQQLHQTHTVIGGLKRVEGSQLRRLQPADNLLDERSVDGRPEDTTLLVDIPLLLVQTLVKSLHLGGHLVSPVDLPDGTKTLAIIPVLLHLERTDHSGEGERNTIVDLLAGLLEVTGLMLELLNPLTIVRGSKPCRKLTQPGLLHILFRCLARVRHFNL